MKNIVQLLLNKLAKATLKKYQPIVIGVTGSMGKTSAKEAVRVVLHEKYAVRASSKSYNTELGMPLTVLGVASGGKNIFKWIGVIEKSIVQLLKVNKEYPEVLVLEMGADKPGDIKYLTDIAPCDIGIVTAVAPVHLELFKTVDAVLAEKKIMLTHMGKQGFAVFNNDDPQLRKIAREVKAEKITFGIDKKSTVQVADVGYALEAGQVIGMRGKIEYNDSSVPFLLPGLVGQHQLYAALAAASVGIALGMNLVEIGQQLRGFKAPRGRLNLLKGKNNTTLIDDSYNSSSEPAKAALRVLHDLPREAGGRTIAIMGNMNELGEAATEYHQQVGEEVAKTGTDYLFAYGIDAGGFCKGAYQSGMAKERISHCQSHDEIVHKVKKIWQPGDVLLIKGSQNNVRLEKVVKNLMAEPERAEELLVRQGQEWQ